MTHFLLSWVIADRLFEKDRDKAAVTLAGVLPDLDGLGVMLDTFFSWTGRPGTDYYGSGHHWLLHGIFGCLILAALSAAVAEQRARVFWAALLTTHLHLFCDLIGSRGADPTDLWSVFYLGPLSRSGELIWRGQWRLDGWQNVSITLFALGWVFRQAWRWGASPLVIVSLRANQALVDTLRRRFGQPPERTRFSQGG